MNRKHGEEMLEQGTLKRLVSLRGVIWRCGLGWIEGHADFFRFGAMRTRSVSYSVCCLLVLPSYMQLEIRYYCGPPPPSDQSNSGTLITQHELQLTMHEFSLGLEFGATSFYCLSVFSNTLRP